MTTIDDNGQAAEQRRAEMILNYWRKHGVEPKIEVVAIPVAGKGFVYATRSNLHPQAQREPVER
jgi:hypothetical protein